MNRLFHEGLVRVDRSKGCHGIIDVLRLKPAKPARSLRLGARYKISFHEVVVVDWHSHDFARA